MKRLGMRAGTLTAAQMGGQVVGLVMFLVTRKIGRAYLGAARRSDDHNRPPTVSR